jgi:hypothetical protein
MLVSTYALLAASVPVIGVATLVIFLLDTSTEPVPFGARTKLLLVWVAVNVLVVIDNVPAVSDVNVPILFKPGALTIVDPNAVAVTTSNPLIL